jgi:UDP-N-acetylglucosamine 4-epimerase
LVTGAAGFIASHLLETLLKLDQEVIGLDNFSTGSQSNLREVESAVTRPQWKRFRLIEGDIRDERLCQSACEHADYVLHHAALGSVPKSLEDPAATHSINVTGFVNMFCAARDHKVKRVVYASSSAVYGDSTTVPHVEGRIGKAISPYGLSKHLNELYAENFYRCFGVESIGLRYFNVFGPRQDPQGAYAAVIPAWITAMIRGEPVFINGDGETTRDFLHVDNVVQANLLAATASKPGAVGAVFNIALGRRTTLNELFAAIRGELSARLPKVKNVTPKYREFRAGDVPHSHADISLARAILEYEPVINLKSGLASAMDWYVKSFSPADS